MKNSSTSRSLNVPRGVSGKQRQLYLGLTDHQKVVYRYHFDVMGQPAGLCHAVATNEQDHATMLCRGICGA